MKDLFKIAFGVVCGLLAAGLVLLVARPPAGPAIALLPPPTHAPLLVHVSGAVAAPGIYSVSPGSRVQAAIDAAGGMLPQADPQGVTLAAWLEDGQQILVPTLAPTPAPTATLSPAEQQALFWTPEPRSVATVFTWVSPSKDNPVNINTADQLGLEALPDIGSYRAIQIINYRTAHGPYQKIEDLLKVPGIPEKTFEIIKDLVTVGEVSPEATSVPSATPTR